MIEWHLTHLSHTLLIAQLQHEALVEVPDPSKPHGTVAFVQKTGYALKGRVIRAASVAVVRNK